MCFCDIFDAQTRASKVLLDQCASASFNRDNCVMMCRSGSARTADSRISTLLSQGLTAERTDMRA